MEDAKIIELFWARDEKAIEETASAHGSKLHRLAQRIVLNREDAQECVSDTYYAAWDSIPPNRPVHFFAYLAKICRNFAFGLLERNQAQKRQAVIVELTAEMQQCIPDRLAEARLEGQELGRVLNAFLGTLSRDNRLIFLRRYWYADSVTEIASRYGMSQSKVKTQLHRVRSKFKTYLESEGIDL